MLRAPPSQRTIRASVANAMTTPKQTYIYDAFGRRVAETYYIDGESHTKYYVYPPAADLRHGDRVVEELDGDGNMTAG